MRGIVRNIVKRNPTTKIKSQEKPDIVNAPHWNVNGRVQL